MTRRPVSPCRRRGAPAVVATAVMVVSVTMALGARSAASFPVSESFDQTPRPNGAISVIGDSVLLGSALYAPTIGEQLAANGWGPVRVRAGGSYTTGAFPVTPIARASYWIGVWRAGGWDAPNVVVNLGTNDSGFCTTSLPCARDAIMHLVDAIGPGHRIWWPKVTRSPQHSHWAANWNLALDQIAAERPDFFTWDWPAVMAAEGLAAVDNIHLSPDGYRRRSELMAVEITAVLARATRTGTDAPLPTPSGSASEVLSIGPIRVLDTRSDPRGRVAGGSAIEVDVSGAVPADTTAVAAYVAATGTAAAGFLTAYDCDHGRPVASAANYPPGGTRGAVTIAPVSADGVFCLYTHATADLVVDVQSAFVPAGASATATRFTPLATPTRLVDTRASGRRRVIEVAVPAGAAMASISVAAIDGATRGFLTAYPCSESVPVIATVNHGPNEVVAGMAFVPVGPDGTICVYAKADVDVTIDLTGTFAVDGDLVFVPVPPTRMIDTRDATGGWSPIHGWGQTIDARVAAPQSEAVSGTLTIVRPVAQGHLRAWGCGPLPGIANVVAPPGAVVANSLTTGLGDGGQLCVYARSTTSTVFDTTGWWIRQP